ncbi:MAG: HAD-IIIA family hydrolase [Pseudomonadota bacterium]|nr:HAD-IIIA family hydrolase [Pseudomonadota bacterium]
MHIFHDKLRREARTAGGHITDIAFCPHHPLSVTDALRTPCACRKPEPGLIRSLAEKWQLDLDRSFVIGDRLTDLQAGQAAGCTSYLVGQNQSLLEVAEQALAEAGRQI